ncbi:MAG: hypothetical protein EBT47_09045 [Chloroflexi bacterium]|nr:hypothetical protein [Chloroflexota bacterium]
MELANVNDVGDRVVVGGACTPDVLGPLVGSGSLIFCDCEGYELHLLDPAIVPGLEKTAIIVELHDVWVPGLAERLLGRFLATHKVYRIGAIPRDWRIEPVSTIPGLTEQERTFAVSDWRDPYWSIMIVHFVWGIAVVAFAEMAAGQASRATRGLQPGAVIDGK